MQITVVITHFNKPFELLKKCIKSIEKYNLKYIIVDDCSDLEYKKDLLALENVIYLEKNQGTYKAFKHGLDFVTTEYTMRVDADDYILGVPNLETMRDAYINDIDNKISLNPLEFLKRPFAGFGGTTVKTDILKKIWFSEIRYYGDIVNFTKLIHGYDCVFNDTNLYHYNRTNNNSITHMKDRLRYIEIAKKIAIKQIGIKDS